MHGHSETHEWKHFSKTIHIYNHFVSFVEYIHVILKKYEINIRIPFSESFFLFGERAKLVCNVEKSLLVGITYCEFTKENYMNLHFVKHIQGQILL